MDPETVRLIVEDWGRRLSSKDVRFSVRDYRQVTTQEGDLLYLDPPYKNEDGQYYSGMFDLDEFFGWLRSQKCDYLLSLNGHRGDEDRTVPVPTDLFDEHLLIDNGVSPFERLNDDEALPVRDSLYMRRHQVPSKSNPSEQVVQPIPTHGSDHCQISRKDQIERKERENLTTQVLARLDAIISQYGAAGVPDADQGRLTQKDLMRLLRILGGVVDEGELLHVARAVWLVRYARARGLKLDTILGRSSEDARQTITDSSAKAPPLRRFIRI
jgi:hypothetical protein